jgi:hypothetical protein
MGWVGRNRERALLAECAARNVSTSSRTLVFIDPVSITMALGLLIRASPMTSGEMFTGTATTTSETGTSEARSASPTSPFATL